MRNWNLVSMSLLLLLLLLVGCSSSADPEPAASDPEWIPDIEVIALESSVSGQEYRIYVALPRAYSRDSVNPPSYPVVYLLDGDFYAPLTAAISRQLSFEDIPQLIVVGVGYPTDILTEIQPLRARDLLPTDTELGGGGAADFLQFIQEELVPYIDENYRTVPTNRTLAGHSFGGLFALYALFHAPEAFDHYIAMSPALFYDDRVAFDYEEAYAGGHSELPVKLFLSVGELESESLPGLSMVTNLEEFRDTLGGRDYAGLEMEMAVIEGVDHAASVPGAITRGLLAVFP